MPRQMSTGASAAFAQDEIRPAILGEFEFGSGTVRFWVPGTGEIQFNGHTWYGCGGLGKVGPIEESADGRANGLELELTGVPLTSIVDGVEIDTLAIALNEDWQQRPARIYFGLLTTSMRWAVEPFQVRKGMMDLMQLEEGKTATIKLTIESPYFDNERAEVLRYTAETQRALHSGDKGFDQMAALQDKPVTWNLG